MKNEILLFFWLNYVVFLSSAWTNVETFFQALDRKTSCHTSAKKRIYFASHFIYHRIGMVFQALDRTKTSCHSSAKKEKLVSLLISFIIVLEWSFKHWTGKHHVNTQPKKRTYFASHLIYHRFGMVFQALDRTKTS